jgi:hypothetical protein
VAQDAEILEQVREAFASCPRPEHFTNYTHCCECAEHDDVLRSRDLETLSIEDVGNPAWDPICFISPEGFAYYLPALCRLALSPEDPHRGWYGYPFLFHLRYDGPQTVRILACTPEQRRAVAAVLRHILETRAELADRYGQSHELLTAIEYWSETH